MKPLGYLYQQLWLFASIIVFVAFLPPIIAQTPEAFKYQAVLKDSAGAPLGTTAVGIKFSIIDNPATGFTVYSEKHTVVTSAGGLVNINIGSGITISGIFSEIIWQTGNYYLEVWVDIDGGSDYKFLGMSKLLAVPYSLHSQTTTGISALSWSQIQQIWPGPPYPSIGTMVFNTSEQKMAYYNGTDWIFFAAYFPNTIANAGSDRFDIIGNTYQLSGNPPGEGNYGLWSVEYGSGGLFANSASPNTVFIAVPGETYNLKWEIHNFTESNADYVTIGFCPSLTIADAGPDQLAVSGTSTTLQGNDPGLANQGKWSVISGSGGSFANANDPNTTFTGLSNVNYKLRWLIYTHCESSEDVVDVYFCSPVNVADAGPDQINQEATLAQLSANTPGTGNTGEWQIVSGQGGVIFQQDSPSTFFYGTPGERYTLSWTISTPCDQTVDYVDIYFFFCGFDLIDVRDDQVYPTVQIGSQCWMAANLNVGEFVAYPPSNNQIIEKYCPGNFPWNCDLYGGLYRWDEMMNYQTTEGSQGICPDGWYIPKLSDFDQLSAFLGGSDVSGGKMKETGNTYWINNVGATNSSGFSGRGAGMHTGTGFIRFMENGRYYSSTTASNATQTFYLALANNNTFGGTATVGKGYFQSVRCIKSN
jgi:uncharacterized protein (TIGR02145 family)